MTATAKQTPPEPSSWQTLIADFLARPRPPEDMIATIAQQAQQIEALKAENIRIVQEAKQINEEIREEIEALCEPENYPGVITDVEQNGKLLVQVQIPGMAPVRAVVHPDVEPERVRIGKLGHLTKARNCLIDVTDEAPPWKDVGTFEEYLDGQRILVNHQQRLIALTLSDDLRDVPLAKGNRIGFDGDGAALAYAKLGSASDEHLFAENVPEDDFSGLGGLDAQIRQIKQTLDFRFKHPEIARRYKLPTKRGILLVGPPGNGKTRIARCAANYINTLMPGQRCRFMCIVGSQDYSMWLGGSEERIKGRFVAAAEAAHDGIVLMFFDEIDAIGRRRGTDFGSAAPERILSTLLGQLDDVQKTLDNVVIMAATNRPDQLDPGLTRPGRLDLKLTIPPPNRRAADHILRRYLGEDMPCCGTVDELLDPLLSALYSPRSPYAQLATVKLSDGRTPTIGARELISGAMLEGVVRRAAIDAALRESQTGQPGISREDLSLALEEELVGMTSLLSPGNVKSYVATIPQDAHPVDVRVTITRRGGYVRA